MGAVVVFLFAVIVIAFIVGAFFLTGVGGYARHKQVEGELGHDDEEFRRLNRDDGDGDPRPPEHARVQDDSKATSDVPSD